jgi:hypothetical protein
MTFVAFAPAAVQPFAVAFVCYLSWNYNSVHDRWFKYTWSRVSYISLEHSHYCSRKGTCSRKDCTVCQTINRQAGNNVCVQDLRYLPKEQFDTQIMIKCHWHDMHIWENLNLSSTLTKDDYVMRTKVNVVTKIAILPYLTAINVWTEWHHEWRAAIQRRGDQGWIHASIGGPIAHLQ